MIFKYITYALSSYMCRFNAIMYAQWVKGSSPTERAYSLRDGCWCIVLKLVQSILPVCDKPYHTNKRKVQKGEEYEVLRNCALRSSLSLKKRFTCSTIEPRNSGYRWTDRRDEKNYINLIIAKTREGNQTN